VIVGFLVIVVLVSAGLLIKNYKKGRSVEPPIKPPVFEQVEAKFPGIKVPENADRAGLTGVSEAAGVGEAFRTYENGRFNITVMADLAATDAFYQAWMAKGDSYLSLGRMSLSKGGYIVEFSGNIDYSDYSKIIVSREKALDGTIEEKVLEGSF